MKPLLCRLGLHRFRFHRPLFTGSGSLEMCRCGRGRIFHWAGAYEYLHASAIEARSDGTGTGPAEGESAIPKGEAQ